jgi:WD40 repeat protein
MKSVLKAIKCCCLCSGVLSIAWCPQDPDLLVSCGKDNHILCWNPNSSVPGGEVVCDITTANQWNFDVSWCPRNPALIASSSFCGLVSVYSLTGGQQQVQTSNKVGHVSHFYFASVEPQEQMTSLLAMVMLIACRDLTRMMEAQLRKL